MSDVKMKVWRGDASGGDFETFTVEPGAGLRARTGVALEIDPGWDLSEPVETRWVIAGRTIFPPGPITVEGGFRKVRSSSGTGLPSSLACSR